MKKNFNFNQIFANGKKFLQNPMTYLVGFPVTLMLLLFSDVITFVKKENRFAVAVFIAVFALLGLFIYLKTCYDRLNAVILDFNKAKAKRVDIGNPSIKNPMGSVEVNKEGKKVVLRGKIKFFGEVIKDDYTIK